MKIEQMYGQLLSVEKFKVDQCDGGTPNVHVANFKETTTNHCRLFNTCMCLKSYIFGMCDDLHLVNGNC